MATGKRYYWMKLKESFMTSDTIDYFMSQPDGANYVVLYQMLCLKTINTNGRLSRQIGEIIIPYDVEKIQRDCKWFSIDTVRVALDLYRAVGLIYEDVDGTLVLADHENLVGSETDWAEKRRRQRLGQEAECPQLPEDTGGDNVPTNVPTDIETDDRDKTLDIRCVDGDVEIEATLPTAEASPSHCPPCPFKKIMELFHSICVSYPRIVDIDGERKKAVAARWRKYQDISKFEEVFRIAENSSFMKGENGRNWSADFDWMMKPTNFGKILEHKYDSRTPGTAPPNSTLGILQKMYDEEGGGQ